MTEIYNNMPPDFPLFSLVVVETVVETLEKYGGYLFIFCKNAAKLTIKTEKSVTFADKFGSKAFCVVKSPLREASASSQIWGRLRCWLR